MMTRPPDAQTPLTESILKRCWPTECAALLVDHARQLELELTAERERGRRVREETIEECARVCEVNAKAYRTNRGKLSSEAAQDCATAIRALSRAESAPEGGKDG